MIFLCKNTPNKYLPIVLFLPDPCYCCCYFYPDLKSDTTKSDKVSVQDAKMKTKIKDDNTLVQ